MLEKSGKPSTEIRQLQTSAIEISNTLNDLKLEFKKNIFYQSTHICHKKCNLKIQSTNTSNYGNKSTKIQIWNSLPEKAK